MPPSVETRRGVLTVLGSVLLGGCHGQSGTDPASPTSGSPDPPEAIEASWPMPGHNPGRSNHAPDATGPVVKPEELWSTVFSESLSAPVLAHETVYVGGDDGVVRAINALTGEQRWETSTGEQAGTPRVLDSSLYVPTDSGITALDTETGSQIWTSPTTDRKGLLVASHGVYYIADRTPPAVISLTTDTGEERWQTDITDPWNLPMLAGDDLLFVPTGTLAEEPWILGAETGRVLGTEPFDEEDAHAEQFLLDDTIFTVQPIAGEIEAYAASSDYQKRWGRLLASDAYPTQEFAGGINHVYANAPTGNNPGLYAFSLNDGSTAWHTDDKLELVTRPVVAQDTVVVLTDNALRCFNPSDGSQRWRLASNNIGPQFILVDDLLYTTERDTLRAFRSLSS